MGGELVTRRRVLPAAPSSASQSRRLIRDVLVAAGRDDLVETAELLVSELVTNALLHAATPVEVTATVGPDGLRVEVADGSTQLPVERDYSTLSGTGRGLALVHRVAQAWGVETVPGGKVVWVELAAADEPALVLDDSLLADLADLEGLDDLLQVGAGDGGDPDLVDGREVAVVLRKVPLLMHSAWHEYAEAFLRDYLLAHLDLEPGSSRAGSSPTGGTAGEAMAVHARAGEAMTLLHDQLPMPELPVVPADLGDRVDIAALEALFADCLEPAATLTQAVLQVPTAMIDNFRALNEVMDAALAMADAGLMLAAAPPPEMRELRRWFCLQIDTQTRGGAPTPWRTPDHLERSTGFVATAPDESGIDRSSAALVAADELNRIIAVSGPALALLGYQEPEDLLGQRLLRVIPSRYHQAHLAGFTLHLTVGRKPLVDRSVTVPFVCADGSERLLDMRLEIVALTDGRRMFVATLSE